MRAALPRRDGNPDACPEGDDDGDRGSVAVLFCFIVLIASTLVTFLVDAGAQIQAANRADSYAAAAAARSYLTQAGATGVVTIINPGVVQVSVTVTGTTPMLGLSVSQTREHTAQLQVGVTHGETLR